MSVGQQESYITIANREYALRMKYYELGVYENSFGSEASCVCELYLKSIIDEFYIPDSETDEQAKSSILVTHSLRKLIYFIQNKLNVYLDKSTDKALKLIDGFYFTTKYPGDNYVKLTDSDFEDCVNAMKLCKKDISRLRCVLEYDTKFNENDTTSLNFLQDEVEKMNKRFKKL